MYFVTKSRNKQAHTYSCTPDSVSTLNASWFYTVGPLSITPRRKKWSCLETRLFLDRTTSTPENWKWAKLVRKLEDWSVHINKPAVIHKLFELAVSLTNIPIHQLMSGYLFSFYCTRTAYEEEVLHHITLASKRADDLPLVTAFLSKFQDS